MLSKAFERRAMSFQQVFGTGGFFGTSTYSGVSVTQDNSLRISTAYACVRLLADTVSTLPVDSCCLAVGIPLARKETSFTCSPRTLQPKQVATGSG